MSDNQNEARNGPPEGTPKPELSPLRMFEVVVLGMNGDERTETVSAHAVDFTTAGGIFFTEGVVTWDDDAGWMMSKRYRRGFAHYERFQEVTPVLSSASLIVH